MRYLFFLVLFLPQSLWAIRNYSLGQTLHVLAIKGLNLRDRPHGDKVVKALPYGSLVMVAEQPNQDYPYEVDGIKGFWVKVRVGETTTGYVFDGFLSSLPAPDANCRSLEAYCQKAFKTFLPKSVLEITDWGPESGLSTTYLQAFEYQNKIVSLTEDVNPTLPKQELTLPGVSPEEAWLIARVCLKDELEAAKTSVPATQRRDDNELPVQAKHYDEFGTLSFEGWGCWTWPLSGTNRYLTINETDGAVSVTFSLR